MRIVRCLYREERQSLIFEERSEVRGLFEVEHDGKTGFLRYDAEFYKRDATVTYFCDVPGVTIDTLANGFQQEPPFYIDEEVWSHEPASTVETPEIRELLAGLARKQLKFTC